MKRTERVWGVYNMELIKILFEGIYQHYLWIAFIPFNLQSETLLDLLGGGPTPEQTPAPVQPPAPAASSGGDLLDLLGDLDLGSTNAGQLYHIFSVSCTMFIFVWVILSNLVRLNCWYLYSSRPGPPPMNMMAPSPAVPNLLDGGGLLTPAPSGMPAQLQLNHEPIAAQNQTPDFSSGLYIKKPYHFCSVSKF